MEKKHKVIVELSTDATLEVFKLEGYIISLTRTLDNTYRIAINEFPIENDLDYFVHCSGWDGTPWKLKIQVDGKDVTDPAIEGEIEKGYSAVRGSIKI
jgi:hypothetical protein